MLDDFLKLPTELEDRVSRGGEELLISVVCRKEDSSMGSITGV